MTIPPGTTSGKIFRLRGKGMRRLGTPDEVADVIHFLCEKGSSYVSGAEIQINGGQHV